MSADMAVNLAAECPCGHTANYHRTRAQQQWRLLNSGGRATGECKGADYGDPHCHCIASREDVSDAAAVA